VNNTTAFNFNIELCKINEIYKDIIDNSVYNTGLRLIGSYKINKPTIYKLYDLEKQRYNELNNIQELKDSSINNLEKLKNTFVKEQQNDIKKNEIFTNNLEIKRFELKQEDIVSIQQQGDISFILIKERHCPFYNKEHKRKQSYLYYIINTKRDTCNLHCYNSECKGKSIKIKTKMDEFVQDKKELIKSSLYGGHYSVAKLISELYPSKYRVDNLKNKTWYEFNGTRWVEQSCGLHVMLSEEMPKYYFKYIDLIETDDKTDEEIQDEKKNVYNIIKKLETTPYKKNILEELANIYYFKDSQFYKKLDSNPLLIGFENGVYDLSLFKFREGLYNDYITFSTGYNYIEMYNENERNEIMEFLSKIITDNDIKEYLLTILGKSLSGLLDDKFFVWTGITGANGKSTLINFLEMALGDYSTSIDISLLTQKRTASSNATPDLIRLRGKRLFSLQEPEHNDVIRTGLLKQLTGGDNIIARELFKSPVSFKLQGTMLLCCNDLPTIASTDGGTWRRLRVIEFNSRFCDNPTKVNEFKIIPNVKQMLEKWKSTFMLILIDYYKKYAIDMNYIITEPCEVIASTNKYKHDNDKFSDFIEECIEESKKKFIKNQT
jgi:P4 family phage/plasmid primase-like protien